MESLSSGEFEIDPAIPIPVEIPPDDEKLNLEDLSWEMILSGMIKVVAQNPGGDDADYYRRFVLAVKPDILSEFSEAAILKARNGEFDLALEIFAALRGLFPSDPSILLNIALVYEHRADVLEREGSEEEAETDRQRAFETYKYFLTLNPPFPNGIFNGGFFFLKQRNYEKALEYFSAYVNLADEPGKKGRAASIIKEIETRGLDDQVFKEAFDFIRMGQEDRGIAKAREFITRHPEVWNGWFILGWGLRKLERWSDAAKAFEKALELGGDGADTRNELAICLMEMDDLRGARRELETALRLESENVKVISNLGVLALKSGKTSEAAGFFRTVLEIDPSDPLALEYLKNLE